MPEYIQSVFKYCSKPTICVQTYHYTEQYNDAPGFKHKQYNGIFQPLSCNTRLTEQ